MQRNESDEPLAHEEQKRVNAPDDRGSDIKESAEYKQAEMFLNRVEKYLDKKTQPQDIKTILEKLKFSSFESKDPRFEVFFRKMQKEPVDMTEFLHQVKLNILSNNALRNLLADIQRNDLISDKELQDVSKYLQIQVNLLCILEAFSISIINSRQLGEEVYRHVIKLRQSYKPGHPIFTMFACPLKTSFFARLKRASIEPAFLSTIFHAAQGPGEEDQKALEEFIKTHDLKSWNTRLDVMKKNSELRDDGMRTMSLNIIEAVATDYSDQSNAHGGKANALAGMSLICVNEAKQYMHQTVVKGKAVLPIGAELKEGRYSLLPLEIEDSPKKLQEFRIDPEWRDLYNAWNLLFVMANLGGIFLPVKLLIPSVLAAEPENFKDLRVISLFILFNLNLDLKLDKNAFFNPKILLKNKKIILQKMGEYNRQEGEALVKKLLPDHEKSLQEHVNEVLGTHSSINLMRTLYRFAQSPAKFNLTGRP